MHLSKVAPVALIEDYHHPLLEHGMILVLLNEDREFLDGGDDDAVVVISSALVLVLQLPLEHGRGSVPVSRTLLESVIFLHRLVVKVFAVHDKENLVDVRQP